MGDERVAGRVIDGHSHIGEMAAWKFYDLKEAVKPTVYEFPTPKDYIQHLDAYGCERGLVLPNYGIPKQEQPFLLNPLVLDAVKSEDRIHGGLWVSFLPQNAEMTREALRHAGEQGNSDISNFIPMVEKYGKRVKIYLVHFGGGVSGHIRLVPRFLDWVEEGYKVYTDTTWTIGFGARWLLTEIEKRGVGHDRVIFASDEPWSDFWGEYWKINGAPVGDELKQRILYQNFEELYTKAQ